MASNVGNEVSLTVLVGSMELLMELSAGARKSDEVLDDFTVDTAVSVISVEIAGEQIIKGSTSNKVYFMQQRRTLLF